MAGKNPYFTFYIIWKKVLRNYFRFRLFKLAKELNAFLKDYFSLKKTPRNTNFSHSLLDFQPCLEDKTSTTAIDPTYFFQSAWIMKKIADQRPVHHYDIGSSLLANGMIAQVVPLTMVDIRPPEVTLEGLNFQEGSILELPFSNDSILSLSSICVTEHIGLGRYGDPLDEWGSEKSFAELQRVLGRGGDLYITVPVDESNKVCFNAHRTFTRDYVLKNFTSLLLVEEKYQYGMGVFPSYDPSKGFGTGYFHFRK